MKNTVSLIGYEIRACLRQLKGMLRLGNVGLLLLTGFCLMLSALLGFCKGAGMNTDLIPAALFALSLVSGLLFFNKKAAAEMLGGEKTQIFMAFPIDYGTLIFVKTEKLLFASFAIYALAALPVMLVLLLAGMGAGLAGELLCCLLAFALGQNLRMLPVLYSEAVPALAVKLAAAAAAVAALLFLRAGSFDILSLLGSAAEAYENSKPALAAALLLCLGLLKLAMSLRPARPSGMGADEVLQSGCRRLSLPKGLNFVTRRDLQIIAHSRKLSRGFVMRLIMAPVTTAAAAVLLRTEVLNVHLPHDYCLWLLAMLAAGGLSELFGQQFAMGYEGSMILGYVLSGSRISRIQYLRVRGSLCFALPVLLLSMLLGGSILGLAPAKLAASALIGCAGLILLTLSTAFYAIKGSDYLNDMNRPNMLSGVLSQIFRTGLDMLVMLPVLLAEFIPEKAYFILAAALAVLMAALILLYTNKLLKGDGHFYGEYQSFAV